MYQYVWDEETGGLLLTSEISKFSKEPRPVYYKELDILGFDKYWNYPKDDSAPIMWAEANNYIYRGKLVAQAVGGYLHTKPELNIIDNPEAGDADLRLVDLQKMVEKNHDLMETLSQDTIKNVYNEYCKYKDKVDIFHVSFSGGKDSVVNLDIIQRAIPHDEFIVLFGDTGMEFPDTIDVVEKVRNKCAECGIKFFTARCDVDPHENWKVFGPPSTTIRWCCSVHKTTPQLLFLRDYVGKDDLVEMAFVGIRHDESIKRNAYEYTSLGTKHKGQYSCNPIIEWSSAEVYLYIYSHNLILNDAYKKGNSRAGCLLCPMASGRHEYIRNQCYPIEVESFEDIIRETNGREYPTLEDTEHFINVGGWKVRNNGRDIVSIPIKYKELDAYTIEVTDPSQNWKEWMKTLGEYYVEGNTCVLKYGGETHSFKVDDGKRKIRVTFSEEIVLCFSSIVKLVKQVFRKAAYCIGCKECQADCPYGYLRFLEGKVSVSDECKHCLNCHKPNDGCLLYHSLEQPKGNGKMDKKAIDCYADHAPKIEWIQSFFELKDDFFENHNLGSVMINMFKRFLRDAELIDNNHLTETAVILDNIGLGNPSFWGILLVNLSHTAEVGWYVRNIPFDTAVKKDYLIQLLRDSGAKERGAKSVAGAYRRILALPFGEFLGLGEVFPENRSFYIIRGHWQDPVPEVILYSLYKFAEACGGYLQFTLEELMDDTIERDGVSPTRIFGLDRETMVRILNGLSVNYPEFISASFTLDLDTVSLAQGRTSMDVLRLF